jgi:retinol dehydrogenase 14
LKLFSDEIAKETGNENLIVMKVDLSSFESIREFAKEFIAKESKLHVLIHNAGYGGAFAKHTSVDGIEITYAINHYGPFLLTHLLIDLMKKSAPSRIVIVASDLYKLAKVNLQNLNPTTTWPTYLHYSSKGANIMFALELAKRLEGTNVTANCLHPGKLFNNSMHL